MVKEFWDGCDSYVNGGAGALGYQNGGYIGVNGSSTVEIVAGRFAESQGIQITSNNAFGARGRMFRSRTNPSAFFSVGAAFKLGDNLPASLLPGVGNAPTEAGMGICLRHISDGRLALSIRSGAGVTDYTNLAETEDFAIFLDQWNYYNLYGEVGVAGNVHASLNGFPIPGFSFTGIDTRSSLVMTDVTHTGLFGLDQNNMRGVMDDLVIRDDDDPIPDCRSYPLRPNADGAHLDWVPSTGATNFGVIDEVAMSTADYISASTPGDYSLIGLQDLPYVPDAIYGVAARGLAAKSDAASRAMYLGLELASSTIEDGTLLALSTDPAPVRWQLEANPDTAVAWTAAEVNGLQLRPIVDT